MSGRTGYRRRFARVRITEAEGKHQVAVEACEAMAGAEQEACKARADEELAAAKQSAEALRTPPGAPTQ